MPKIFDINGYQISIWSNENGEPIHVHISKRKPTQNSTKAWLLSNGIFVLAHNKGRIPDKDLKVILSKLNTNAELIRQFWVSYHGYQKFYK